jgi:hypothetical protein
MTCLYRQPPSFRERLLDYAVIGLAVLGLLVIVTILVACFCGCAAPVPPACSLPPPPQGPVVYAGPLENCDGLPGERRPSVAVSTPARRGVASPAGPAPFITPAVAVRAGGQPAGQTDAPALFSATATPNPRGDVWPR